MDSKTILFSFWLNHEKFQRSLSSKKKEAIAFEIFLLMFCSDLYCFSGKIAVDIFVIGIGGN